MAPQAEASLRQRNVTGRDAHPRGRALSAHGDGTTESTGSIRTTESDEHSEEHMLSGRWDYDAYVRHLSRLSKKQKLQRAADELAQNVRSARREVSKRKVSFCLGFTSVFLVVMIVALASTALAKAPFVFLRIAEADAGEIDMTARSGWWTGYDYLNFTQVQNNVGVRGEYVHNSPRFVEEVSVFPGRCGGQDVWDPAWKYASSLPSGASCSYTSTSTSCVALACDPPIEGELYAIDTLQEKSIGCGRNWTLPPPAADVAYVHVDLANSIGVHEGDTIIVRIATRTLLDNMKLNGGDARVTFIPYRVGRTFADANGKFALSVDNALIVEYDALLQHMGAHVRPAATSVSQALTNGSVSLREYAEEVIMNLPPNRIDAYIDSNFDAIQERVVDFASRSLFEVGFTQIDASLEILNSLRGMRFFALFLGLILTMIITILVALSILLIYSLLMISVETRTFEMGVMRMVGMTKRGVVQLVLVQAFLYALPAWALGLIAAQVVGSEVLLKFMSELAGADFDRSLTPSSIGIATALGLLIPLISAVFPIRKALTQNVNDAVDLKRSRTVAVKFSIERSEDTKLPWALIAGGSAVALFGFLVYYLFPLALLSFNIQLLLYMFFGLLLGMLLGLVVLSLNLEHPLEKGITLLCLWWEKRSTRDIVLKNLVAHRPRNRKTTVMYALSLAFIVFVAVSYNLQIITFTYQTQQRNGVNMSLRGRGISNDYVVKLEAWAMNEDGIEDFSWKSRPLFRVADGVDVDLRNLGKIFVMSTSMYAVSPNFYNTTLNEFLKLDSRAGAFSTYSLSEALYSVYGSQSSLLGSLERKELGVDLDSSYLLAIEKSSAWEVFHRMRPMAFLDLSPALTFSKFPSVSRQDTVVSFPAYVRLSNGIVRSVEDIPMESMLLKLRSGLSDERLDQIKGNLTELSSGVPSRRVFDKRDLEDRVSVATLVMEYFSIFTTVVAMGLSFFSLMSSMYANIFEQTKEIGILRAMGLSRGTVVKIYCYEAFVLVTSASIMGIFIGTAVGFTMTLQRVIFTQLPIGFTFPLGLTITVLVMAVFVAFFSSYGPARSVVNKSVVEIMRIIV